VISGRPVFVVRVRVGFALDVAVVVVAFVLRPVRFIVAVSISVVVGELRKSVWRDNTVALLHVDVDRIVRLTDSTGESGVNAVMAIIMLYHAFEFWRVSDVRSSLED
jgi:hypothetical protein